MKYYFQLVFTSAMVDTSAAITTTVLMLYNDSNWNQMKTMCGKWSEKQMTKKK